MGLLAGVIGARTTGVGRDIDVSLFDVALHNLCYVAPGTSMRPGRSAARSAPPILR
jgi:crotonobetainyl-CoA:carnitine CoA-transferase CaiB-like acyl-CoA transferase